MGAESRHPSCWQFQEAPVASQLALRHGTELPAAATSVTQAHLDTSSFPVSSPQLPEATWPSRYKSLCNPLSFQGLQLDTVSGTVVSPALG